MFPLVLAIRHVLTVEGILAAFGWMFAMAMLIGAVLDEDGKRLLNWILAIAIFGIAAELFRYNYLVTINHPGDEVASAAITTMVGVVDIAGLALGWGIAYMAKRHVQRKIEREQKESTDL